MIERPWWQHAVTYEVYVRSFADASGDGVGDLEGVRQRLDYLEWLGVDAIWLTPFYRSPMADFGYDIVDHTDVDPLFGTLGDMDRLLADAHAHGIRVIVDYVPNHTSDRHPWFVESRSSRTNPKRDWYYWRDPRPGSSAASDGRPNNWLSLFGGPAWELDPATGQYYLHTFLKEQPDLNWRNPEVVRAMHEVARFWLGRGVDGFRIDVAAAVAKDPELRDNPLDPDPKPGQFGAEWLRQVHAHDFEHPDIVAMWQGFRRVLDEAEPPARVSIAEVASDDLVRWARYYGPQLDAVHMPFGFHLVRADWHAAWLRAAITRVEAAVPDGAWPNWVLGNHDQPRIATWAGPERARVAMLLLLTLRGTPTVYYGDELGMENVPIPPDRAQDPWELNEPGQGRDPARTPMRWTAGPNAGFAPATAEPWLPVGDARAGGDVEAQRRDPGSMLSFTRALLRLRRSDAALLDGAWSPLDAGDGVLAFTRAVPGRRVAVVLNLGADAASVALPSGGRVLLSTLGDGVRAGERVTRAARGGGPAAPLAAWEGLIVELDEP